MESIIVIPSILGEEKKVLVRLDKLLKITCCSENDRMDVRTALAEACLNAIEHGNRLNEDLEVSVRFQITNYEINIEVCDCGEGAALKSLLSNYYSDVDSERGRGLYFINQLSSEWDCCYKIESRQFCVIMRKNFSKAGGENEQK